jgi:hypothetical protein
MIYECHCKLTRASQREASPVSEGDLADSPCLLLGSFAWKRVFALSESDARKRVLVAGSEKDEDGELGELLSICVDGIALVRFLSRSLLPPVADALQLLHTIVPTLFLILRPSQSLHL